MKKFLLLIVICMAGVLKATSQQYGSITGKVTDAKTNEEVIGGAVIIEGTATGSSTDMEGIYKLRNVLPGTYTLVCKSLGYQTKRVEGVVVKAGEITTIHILMEEPPKQEIKEVVISTTVDKEKNTALTNVQRNNAGVMDGVSAESIKRTPDKTTSDVLKRVSGASIQDNKFVIIRGLNDRYNAAYINGAPLPSSESDRKAFSFDIFPANLLDNLVVIKSATPDMPADFAGGIININTKSVPEKNYQLISIGLGYNSITTFKQGSTYQGGKFDWLGIDDGTRAIPSALPSTDVMKKSSISEQGKYASYMPNNWGLKNFNALPNGSIQYTNVHNFLLGGKELGMILSGTYQHTDLFNESVRREFDEASEKGGRAQQQFELTDRNYSRQVLAGVLANFSYRMNENNTIGFKNLFNINAEDKVTVRSGIREFESDPQFIESSNSMRFTSNKLYTGQLMGDHFIPKAKMKIHWIGSASNITRDIPNLRRMMYTRPSHAFDPSEPDPQFIASVPISGSTPTSGGNIFNAINKEQIYSFNADFTLPINFGKHIVSELKAGSGYQYRNRNFDVRQMGLTQYKIVGGGTMFDNSLLTLPQDQIFDPSHIGIMANGKGGFKLEEQTKFNDSYKAGSTLFNYFIMMDTRIREKLRVIYGMRMESFAMHLNSAEDDGAPIHKKYNKADFLPSVNVVYSLSKSQNLRFCYSNTVSRPEYREIAPFGFYDFVTNYTTRGNPDLKRALIYNYDARYEFFPGKGQLISASLFYKSFRDAIEQVTVANTTPEINYKNVSRAVNYGMEVEMRLLLSTLTQSPESHTILNCLTVYNNVALIKSDISITDVAGAVAEKRPLQGQSPFIINSGVQYMNDKNNFSLSVSYNLIGRRIAIVGNSLEPNIWENGRNLFDVQVAKSFLKNKNLEVKVNIKDMMAQKQVFYQDINLNKRLNPGTDNIVYEVTNGRVMTVGVSYKF